MKIFYFNFILLDDIVNQWYVNGEHNCLIRVVRYLITPLPDSTRHVGGYALDDCFFFIKEYNIFVKS